MVSRALLNCMYPSALISWCYSSIYFDIFRAMKKLIILLLLVPSLSWGLDKDELKDELKYWKSLLDDELISLEDYNSKKSELLSDKNINKIDLSKNVKKNNKNSKSESSNQFILEIMPSQTQCLKNIGNFNKYNDSKKFIVSSEISKFHRTGSYLNYVQKNEKVPSYNGNMVDMVLDIRFFDDCKLIGYEVYKLYNFAHTNILYDGFDYDKKISTPEALKYIFNELDDLLTEKFVQSIYLSDKVTRRVYPFNKLMGNEDVTLVNTSSSSSTNNMASELDTLMNSSNTSSSNKTANKSNSISTTSSSKSSKCSGLNSDKNWVYKGLTGYFSKKDACVKIASYSDDELCSKVERGKDKTLNPYENQYKKEVSSRGVACIDGIAFDKSDSTTKILQSQKKLEEKMEKKMACTARRTEWKTLCRTGDYRMVNGVLCGFSTFRC